MRQFALIVAILMVVSCTNISSLSDYARDNGEKLLIDSSSYASLIARYEQEVKDKPSTELRFKLANAHYHLGDGEAAMFQLSQIPPQELSTAPVALLRANILYDQGEFQFAEQHVNTALRKDATYAEAYNLKGLILAHTERLTDAKDAFETARKFHYSDALVKNNLSMISILEGNYKEAIHILTPLIQSGRADDTAKANLLFALAKTGQTQAFSQMLVDSEKDMYLAEKYKSLNTALPTSINTHNKSISALKDEITFTNADLVEDTQSITDTPKQIKKNKQEIPENVITALDYHSTSKGYEYIVTSTYPLGNINSSYNNKNGQWMFDIEEAINFTPERKHDYIKGPVKTIGLDEHNNFVRLVMIMRDKSNSKPETRVEGNKLYIIFAGQHDGEINEIEH